MARRVVRVAFDTDGEASALLARCLGEGLDAVVEERRPMGMVKRNGPDLAAWLKRHPGWHEVGRSANRKAAWAAAWKIRSGTRRGFEDGGFEARAERRGDGWVVLARHMGRRRGPAVVPEDMEPLF